MTQDIFESFNAFNKNAFEAFKTLGELNLRIGEKVIQEQVKLFTSLVEVSSKNAESVSKAKDVQDVIAKSSAVAQESSNHILQSYRSCADTLTQARDEYTSLAEKSLEEANKNFKATADKKAA
jgi:phasin family protein